MAEKGLPFRDAYKITGELVALCIQKGLTLETLPLEEYQAVYEQVSRVNTPIKDRRKYILASLVTIREDLDLAVEMDVQRDFGQSS